MSDRGLSSFELKWIAIFTMLTDHVGAVLFPEYRVLRGIGRISFPIFCFLLVEGFHYTHDRKRYFERLLLFAFLSEIPFDLAVFGKCFAPQHQNVFFTLALGILMMSFLEQKYELKSRAMILVIMILAVVLRTDYSVEGLFIIYIFYMFRENRKMAAAFVASFEVFVGVAEPKSLQWAAALAMLPILCYNKEQGRKMKYFFYLFYPAHLFILWGITRMR